MQLKCYRITSYNVCYTKLLRIFVIIYLNTRSLVKTGIVFLAVPLSLVGAFWLMYLLGYHTSIARNNFV